MKQIYLHGLGQTGESWGKVIEAIGSSEECVVPNLTELVKGEKADYPELYAAFCEICNKIDGKVMLCGLSLGGVMALNYAIDHPEKVQGLVLIAAQYRMPKMLLKLQNVLFRLMSESSFQQMGFSKRDFISLCSTMAVLDFSASLDKVSCPTIVICGEKDSANKKAATELAGRIPHAELQMISGAGHEINTEVPEKLAELLQEFYQKIF